MVRELQIERPNVGISRACRTLQMSRSSNSYQSIKDDSTLMASLTELAEKHPREGFWKSYYRIRNSGGIVNHKRLHRIYKAMSLPIRRKIKKRLPARIQTPLVVPESFNHTWSIDFVSDALANQRKFRSFNVIDDYNREVLFIETDYSLKSSRIIWVLRHLVNKHGKPTQIRMDNGPEFIGKITQDWSKFNEIDFKYIQPGKPTQNAYIERFNRTYREAVLDAYLFDNLEEVREATADWMHEYNHHRPHDSLGGLSPIKYKEKNITKVRKEVGLRSATPPSAQLPF